jgi:hypothetical protein
VDGQRADGQGWYGDEQYGDPPHRYAGANDDRYGQRDGFGHYGEEQPEQAYSGDRRSRVRRGKRSGLAMPDSNGYGEGSYDERDYAGTEYGDGQQPEPQFQEPQYQDPRYGEYADRAMQGGQPLSGALGSGPVVTPVVPAPGSPAGAQMPGSPMSGSPTALHAPTAAIPAGARPAPTATYRSRRPGLAVVLTLAGVISELVLLKVLLSNMFHSGAAAVSGTLGGLFAVAGVPMVIIGLYALATGAATASGPHTGRAWLRTPLAYLPVGLILIVAAGLAAG